MSFRNFARAPLTAVELNNVRAFLGPAAGPAPPSKFVPLPLVGSAGYSAPRTLRRHQHQERVVNHEGVPSSVDPDLPAPMIQVGALDTLRPELALFAPGIDLSQLTCWWEFDTSPRFDSPNFWRWPSLLTYDHDARRIAHGMPLLRDLTGTEGQLFFPLVTKTDLRCVPRFDVMRPPFRLSAMTLPPEVIEIDGRALDRLAGALAWDLNEADHLSEVVAYTTHATTWCIDTGERSAIDTLRAKTAACGHINELMQVLFERQGRISRGVGGFHPLVRPFVLGAGHAAVEVMNAGGGWEYVDAFFGIVARDECAASMSGTHGAGAVPLFVTRHFLPDGFAPDAPDTINLAETFRYRSYYDRRGRLPTAHMTSLIDEGEYGRDLQLDQRKQPFEPLTDLPQRLRVNVRARYAAQPKSQFNWIFRDPDLPFIYPFTVSEWAVGTFDIPIRH